MTETYNVTAETLRAQIEAFRDLGDEKGERVSVGLAQSLASRFADADSEFDRRQFLRACNPAAGRDDEK